MTTTERQPIQRNYLSNDERIRIEEEELARLKKEQSEAIGEQRDQDPTPEPEDEPDTPEEKTWKKRYGDLRRLEQSQKKEFEARIKELENKFATVQTPVELPKNKKELEEYKKNHPVVANILEEMAKEEAQKLFDSAKDKFDKYDEVTTELSRATAVKKVKKEHSDFDEIIEDDNFHSWIENQPEWFSTVIFDQYEDTKSIIKVIDVYKRENGLTASDRKEQEKENAKGISTRSRTTPDVDKMKGKLKESAIAAMSMREYESRYDEIQTALRSGNIIYDLSEGVR
jgi:hypothetical protein